MIREINLAKHLIIFFKDSLDLNKNIYSIIL
jgi:hypothetical protein